MNYLINPDISEEIGGLLINFNVKRLVDGICRMKI